MDLEITWLIESTWLFDRLDVGEYKKNPDNTLISVSHRQQWAVGEYKTGVYRKRSIVLEIIYIEVVVKFLKLDEL